MYFGRGIPNPKALAGYNSVIEARYFTKNCIKFKHFLNMTLILLHPIIWFKMLNFVNIMNYMVNCIKMYKNSKNLPINNFYRKYRTK